ncbi:hypothetical protein [Ferrimonas pelagia]|uniref:Uncharacterized protein n=1 Tax=Ferrimonas pelagia TaxID=1177826 RepID=A0ABP9F4G7_9GAMM
MSNSRDQLSPANRALIAGTLLGGGTSALRHWQRYQQGEINAEQYRALLLRAAATTGLASGSATFIAQRMAGRPVLSFATLIAAGAAGTYLYQDLVRVNNEKSEKSLP